MQDTTKALEYKPDNEPGIFIPVAIPKSLYFVMFAG